MMVEKIKQDIIQIIYNLFNDRGFLDDISDYTDLVEDLGMDSMTFVSVIIEIESKFNIIFSDDMLQIENFKTIEKIVALVQDICESSQ